MRLLAQSASDGVCACVVCVPVHHKNRASFWHASSALSKSYRSVITGMRLLKMQQTGQARHILSDGLQGFAAVTMSATSKSTERRARQTPASPIKYVLDLRQLAPGESAQGEDSERVARLEAEVARLRDSEARLKAEVEDLRRALSVQAGQSRTNNELAKTRELLIKLQDDYKVALELIVTLGATVAQGGPQAPKTPSIGARSSMGKSEKDASDKPPFIPSARPNETFNAHALGMKPT